MRTLTPTDADRERIATAAERAIADGLNVETDGDRKPRPVRQIALVKPGPAA
jgi:hypothetical protein